MYEVDNGLTKVTNDTSSYNSRSPFPVLYTVFGIHNESKVFVAFRELCETTFLLIDVGQLLLVGVVAPLDGVTEGLQPDVS